MLKRTHFSAGDKHVENVHSKLQPHTHTASYQQLPTKPYVRMIATHMYPPLKTSGSYHALILTSKYMLHPKEAAKRLGNSFEAVAYQL